jgi:4-amino-4-deoxy-L-arabinose transferase-like glycosyltransferase
VAEGDWALPQLFDRRVEMQKPPLYYWLVAIITNLRGGPVDAWTVRLPAALAACGGVLGVYLLGAGRGRPVAGLIAGAVLATCWHYTWMARVGRIDMPLTFTVVLAVAGFSLGGLRLREKPGSAAWPWFLLSYLAVAAGLLLKGPIAVVLPISVGLGSAAVEALVRRSTAEDVEPRTGWWRWAHAVGLWWGVPLVLFLAGPWYVLAEVQTHGDFGRVFFWYHNVERGFGGDGELTSHPWWLYGPRLLADLFPWSLLLPAAGWHFWRSGAWHRDPSARLGLVWLTTIFVLLSCLSFKRADYLLPAYPGAALLLGCVGERWWLTRRARVTAWAFVLVVAGCVGAWWVYLDFVEARQTAGQVTERFAAAVRARTSAPVIFFRTEDHALAFHVGRPIETLLEWENLDAWLAQDPPPYVIMPTAYLGEARARLKNGSLAEILRSSDLAAGPVHRPVVLLRGRRDTPGPGS